VSRVPLLRFAPLSHRRQRRVARAGARVAGRPSRPAAFTRLSACAQSERAQTHPTHGSSSEQRESHPHMAPTDPTGARAFGSCAPRHPLCSHFPVCLFAPRAPGPGPGAPGPVAGAPLGPPGGALGPQIARHQHLARTPGPLHPIPPSRPPRAPRLFRPRPPSPLPRPSCVMIRQPAPARGGAPAGKYAVPGPPAPASRGAVSAASPAPPAGTAPAAAAPAAAPPVHQQTEATNRPTSSSSTNTYTNTSTTSTSSSKLQRKRHRTTASRTRRRTCICPSSRAAGAAEAKRREAGTRVYSRGAPTSSPRSALHSPARDSAHGSSQPYSAHGSSYPYSRTERMKEVNTHRHPLSHSLAPLSHLMRSSRSATRPSRGTPPEPGTQSQPPPLPPPAAEQARAVHVARAEQPVAALAPA